MTQPAVGKGTASDQTYNSGRRPKFQRCDNPCANYLYKTWSAVVASKPGFRPLVLDQKKVLEGCSAFFRAPAAEGHESCGRDSFVDAGLAMSCVLMEAESETGEDAILGGRLRSARATRSSPVMMRSLLAAATAARSVNWRSIWAPASVLRDSACRARLTEIGAGGD